MNEQMQAAADELMAEYPYLTIQYAGNGYPFQAGGAIHNQGFYFRFRHNYASLRVGGDLHFKALYAASAEYGEGEDQGWLEPEEFVVLMRMLIPRLERAEIFWEFPGIVGEDIGPRKAGEPDTYGDWGHTPEHAWCRLHEPSGFLLAHGFDEERQRQMRAAQQLRPQTVTVDDRVFPDPDPFAAAVR